MLHEQERWKPREARVLEEACLKSSRSDSLLFNTLPSTRKGKGVEVAAVRKKKKTSHNRASAVKGWLLPPKAAAAQGVQRSNSSAQLGGANSRGQRQQPGTERRSLGRNHGTATSLVAVLSGDPGGALSYSSPQELPREALLGSGKTVLPDV